MRSSSKCCGRRWAEARRRPAVALRCGGWGSRRRWRCRTSSRTRSLRRLVDTTKPTSNTTIMEHKRHHWVPTSYLDAWVDPQAPTSKEPYVWVFTKDGKPLDHSTTQNLFHKKDLYTIRAKDGSRDLYVETKLLHGIESNFVPVRDKLSRGESLTTTELLHLCAFTAALRGRTLPTVKSIAASYQDVKRQIDRIATAQHKQFGMGSDPDPLASLRQDPTYADVEAMANNPAVAWLVGSLRLYVPALTAMHLTVLRTADVTGFITSDNPCVLTDADIASYPAFYKAPQLGSQEAEVTLPLSPRMYALFSWSRRHNTVTVGPETVELVNRQTCAFSDQRVVVCRNEFRPQWLPIGLGQAEK